MHRLENSAVWRCVLNGLAALGAGFGAMIPVLDDEPDALPAEGEWDWSIPYQWFDHANG